MNTEEKIPQGLSTAQAEERLKKYGKNALSQKKKQGLFHKILHTVSEPMFLLLFAAAIVYFILGEPRDGAIMPVSYTHLDVYKRQGLSCKRDAFCSLPRAAKKWKFSKKLCMGR